MTTPSSGTGGGGRVRGWIADLRVYAEPPVARMLLLGFSAGLPLLLVLGTLSFRLREAGIDRTTIGFLSWVGLAYGFKWAWAPLVDRLPLPLLTRALGRRRGWLLLAQVGLIVAISGMALTDPTQGLRPLVLFALAAAFCSATQPAREPRLGQPVDQRRPRPLEAVGEAHPAEKPDRRAVDAGFAQPVRQRSQHEEQRQARGKAEQQHARDRRLAIDAQVLDPAAQTAGRARGRARGRSHSRSSAAHGPRIACA